MSKKDESFKLVMQSNSFKKNDSIIIGGNSNEFIVTSVPKRKWYHLLLQKVTLGLYKASIYYTVKPK